jgi:hypothetical protein
MLPVCKLYVVCISSFNLRIFIHFYLFMNCAVPVDISTAVSMSIFTYKLNIIAAYI